jgi:peroxin-10
MVRALQKDEFFLTMFKDNCRELWSGVLGNRFSNFEHALDLLSHACYNGFTTLIGTKSLGEEYCDLAMVCSDLETRPSQARRGFLFVLEVCVPYLLQRLRNLPRPHRNSGVTGKVWSLLLALLHRSEPLLTAFSKLHLGLFYLFGRYLQLSKRGAGIRYVFLRKLDMPRPGYTLLGVLLVVHLSVLGLLFLKNLCTGPGSQRLGLDAYTERADYLASSSEEDDAADEANTCTLCLCPREDTTVTECGHLYCWECIARALSAKPECPMCRSSCSPPQLLRLCHYS